MGMKGQLQDIIVIAGMLFSAAIVCLICYMVLDNLGADPNLTSHAVAATAFTAGKQSLIIVGNSFIFIVICFGLAAAIASFYTETHPVFFVFSLLIFVITFMLTWIFSELFIEIASTGAMLPVAAQFVAMVEVMQNMPLIAVLLGAVIIMALYLKRSDISQMGGGQA